MPKVGSRYSKFGSEKTTTKKQTTTTTTANKLHLVLKKKKKKKPAELGFLSSSSQTRRKCIYERWTTGAGWGEALRLFYGKHVLAILKTVRLDWNLGIIHECSRSYRNNAILSFHLFFYLSVRAVYNGNPFDFYPFNTNDHRYPYLNSIYK